jgi:preprotein translocase subunit SecG
MEILRTLALILFLLSAVLLVYIVLIQEPKQTGGDLLGGATDLFNTRGITGGLYRLTIALGVIFAVLAIIVGRISG